MNLRWILLSSVLAVSGAANAVIQSGDIALVGINSDNPDSFTIVALRDLAVNESFSFADSGLLSTGGFRGSEGAKTLTLTSAVSAGKVISFTGASIASATVGGTSVGAISVNGDQSNFALNTDGDQLFLFTGDFATPTLIAGYDIANAGWSTTATNATSSAQPTGVPSAYLGSLDNAEYTGTRTGTRAQLLAELYKESNWTPQNTLITLNTGDFTVQAVPEPASMAVLGLGLVGIIKRRRKG